MLSGVFSWLDQHPGAYWATATFASAAFIATCLAPPSRNPDKRGYSTWWHPVSLMLLLLAWRWPYLLSALELNPDESQLIAGALTLRHDPVFWRAVDGTTSGPLNFYVLLPLHWLGLPLDYFSARLTGLLLVWVALLFTHRTLLHWVERPVANLAVLAPALFFACVTDPDFVHYSSEHLSIALIAVAGWLLIRPPSLPHGLLHAGVGAFVAGLLPWSKLQSVPLSGTLLLAGLWLGFSRPSTGKIRSAIVLLFAFVAPSLIALALILVAQVQRDFWAGYIVDNLFYTQRGTPLQDNLALLYTAMSRTHQITWYLGAATTAVSCSLVWALRKRPERLSPLFLPAVGLIGVSIFTILAPGRPFLHYLLFLILPPILLLTCALDLGRLLPVGRSRALRLTLGLIAMTIIGHRMTLPPPEPIGLLAEHWRKPRSALGEFVHRIIPDGRSVAVWGWLSSVYVESGRPQASRQAQSERSTIDIPLRDYHRSVFLADLQRNEPWCFIDATGPHSHYFTDRTRHGFEIFPALAEYIRQHYRFVGEIDASRIYVRTDLPMPQKDITAQLQHSLQSGRLIPIQRAPEKTPDDLTWTEINGARVRRLLPPRSLAWQLSGHERSVAIRYGMEPQSFQAGNTDGAGITVELQLANNTSLPVFHRFLNPSLIAGDRSPQTMRMVLPPYEGPAELVVRSDAGLSDNEAWDRMYVESVAFQFSSIYLLEQFPGFNRTPVLAVGSPAHLVREGDDLRLMLPAPARLVFDLDPADREIELIFGLSPGAYTGEGRTDGITLKATVRDSGIVVSERKLQPLRVPADTGPQVAYLSLPAFAPGAQLEIQIEPGSSNAWDWAYISRLLFR